MVRGGERDDARETAEISVEPGTAEPVNEKTLTVRPAAAETTTETVAVGRSPRHAMKGFSPWGRVTSWVGGVSQPRRARFWLPVGIVAVLLIGAGIAGGFLVPRAIGPKTATGGDTPTGSATSGPTDAQPSLSQLPNPPTRPADGLARWANDISSEVAIPIVAVQAYGYAQLVMERADPTCHLSWTTLAGIGEVESHHGQAGGAVLQPGGRSSPAIVGPLLDGKDGRAKVTDTDAGAFDGDATFDRAMGPLRLMPSVWRTNAIDADSDGILDPYDLDDAALALARLFCSGTEDLRSADGWNAAITRYHEGTAYAQAVFKVADDYGQRTKNIG